jgi:hypothetical protein
LKFFTTIREPANFNFANNTLLVVIACLFLSFTAHPKVFFQPGNVTPLIKKKPNVLDFFLKEDSSSCVIPFNKVGNLILVKAKADSTEGNFILDTGSPYLVLNVVYFRNYPVTVASDENHTSISGVNDAVTKTTVKQFSFGTLKYYWEKADLIDLGHIENSKGVKILGLIGLSLLQQCEVIIDYSQSLIYLHRIGKKEAKNYRSEQLNDASLYTTIPIIIEDQKIIAKTEMAGKKLQFMLDSGSETNILDSRLSDKVFDQVDITGRINVRGTGNALIEALQGNLKGMKLGSENLENLPVLITNLDRTCFSNGSCINGVLSLEFLPLKKIGFNFVTRKMYLWK